MRYLVTVTSALACAVLGSWGGYAFGIVVGHRVANRVTQHAH